MNNTKRNNILSVTLIFLLVAAVGFMFGTIMKNLSADEAGSTTGQSTTLQPDSAVPVSSTFPSGSLTSAVTENAATQATITSTVADTTSAAPKAETTGEVCATYNNAVNALKQYTENFTVHKDEKIQMEITEFSLPAPTEQINSVMRSIVPDTLEDYTFQNGVRTDEPEIGVTDTIPPFGENAAVSELNVSTATVADTADSKEITLVLLPEKASFDGNATTPTPNLSSVLDELDFATFDMGPIGVQKAEISYSEVTLTASLDSVGRLTKLVIVLPVIVFCTGGMSIFTADVGLDMSVTTVYEISYQ